MTDLHIDLQTAGKFCCLYYTSVDLQYKQVQVMFLNIHMRFSRVSSINYQAAINLDQKISNWGIFRNH